MSVNIIALGINVPSARRWERRKSAQSYLEYQRLKLLHVGKLQTPTMRIEVIQCGKIRVTTSMQSFEATAESVLEHLAEILEIGRSLPIMMQAPQASMERWGHTLPDYGVPGKTRAEEYAERLRQDKWDVRKYGDPAEIPQAWKSFGKVKGR